MDNAWLIFLMLLPMLVAIGRTEKPQESAKHPEMLHLPHFIEPDGDGYNVTFLHPDLRRETVKATVEKFGGYTRVTAISNTGVVLTWEPK